MPINSFNRLLLRLWIGVAAFAGTTEAQIPFDWVTNSDNASVTILGYTGPAGTVTIPAEINGLQVTAIQGVNGNPDGPSFGRFGNATSVVIPPGVTELGEYAFAHCPISSVVIPTTVTNIELFAFSDCDNLTNVNLPEGLTTLVGGAFYACSSLTTVTIPGSLPAIEGVTFWECSSLRACLKTPKL